MGRVRTTRLIDSLTIQAEGWTDRILTLDADNTTGILGAVGLEFPEEKRRKGLQDPSTILIALLDGESVDGYVEFRQDWNHGEDIYLSSIQVRQDSRHGLTLGILIAECAKALSSPW